MWFPRERGELPLFLLRKWDTTGCDGRRALEKAPEIFPLWGCPSTGHWELPARMWPRAGRKILPQLWDVLPSGTKCRWCSCVLHCSGPWFEPPEFLCPWNPHPAGHGLSSTRWGWISRGALGWGNALFWVPGEEWSTFLPFFLPRFHLKGVLCLEKWMGKNICGKKYRTCHF